MIATFKGKKRKKSALKKEKVRYSKIVTVKLPALK